MTAARKSSKRASKPRSTILAKAVREPTRKSAPVSKGSIAEDKLQPPRQPMRPRRGGTDPGPRNVTLDRQNPDLFIPPKTDAGILPNLRFSFADAHMRLERGGWTREITVRELPISTNMAGVDMRLNAGAIREMHWHKEAEWAYMLYGRARITGNPADKYKFRTPPLRNVELTAPYGHNGAFFSLREFVAHYSESHLKLAAFTDHELEPLLKGTIVQNLSDILATRDILLDGVAFPDQVIDEVTEFMMALTDPRARHLSSVMPTRVPSGLTIDGLRE